MLWFFYPLGSTIHILLICNSITCFTQIVGDDVDKNGTVYVYMHMYMYIVHDRDYIMQFSQLLLRIAISQSSASTYYTGGQWYCAGVWLCLPQIPYKSVTWIRITMFQIWLRSIVNIYTLHTLLLLLLTVPCSLLPLLVWIHFTTLFPIQWLYHSIHTYIWFFSHLCGSV